MKINVWIEKKAKEIQKEKEPVSNISNKVAEKEKKASR